MKVLVLNCGSSTLKFQLIETARGTDAERKLARGIVDRIGGRSSYKFESNGGTDEKALTMGTHDAAARQVVEWLRSKFGLDFIDAVGHRVVHGGDQFTASVLINDKVVAALEALADLAPLHNPAALSGIRAARKIFGETVPMVAAFDTSFHHTIAAPAATYAIPYELSRKHRIRRYGFHGIAHQYDLARYAEINGKQTADVSIVTLHLGNGCSASAIRNGRSVDTSMGFTPLEGLVMGTRSGDLDPALISYLARKENVDAAEVESWLNKRSGLLGLSERSNDMRELAAAYDTDPRARLAIDVFCHRARKYIGAYFAVLEGAAEALIFSGGIGENSTLVRREICRGMEWCGLRLDETTNAKFAGRDGRISARNSRRQIFVIHTDEEALIAREVAAMVGNER